MPLLILYSLDKAQAANAQASITLIPMFKVIYCTHQRDLPTINFIHHNDRFATLVAWLRKFTEKRSNKHFLFYYCICLFSSVLSLFFHPINLPHSTTNVERELHWVHQCGNSCGNKNSLMVQQLNQLI